jgi:translation initiation factor IF-2
MAGRPIRLGKAAGELNVGLENLVEFLGSKDIEIDKSPNTKLTSEQYELLCSEFAADQDLKEKSKVVLSNREKRESLSIKDTKDPQPVKEDPEPVKEDPEPAQKAPEEARTPEPKIAPEKDLKVVGKIDLDALKKKPKPEPNLEKKSVEEPKAVEEKPADKPEVIETIKIERKKNNRTNSFRKD